MAIMLKLFEAIRKIAGRGLTQSEVDSVNEALTSGEQAAPVVTEKWDGRSITPRTAAEIVSHEAIVAEAYKDSVGVWTWGVGVTDASGHRVGRYKDAPQSVRRCLEVYVWLLETNYAPAVRAAFAGFPLTEAQFAAALSFHYNTGAIGKAQWVKDVLAAKAANGYVNIMQWRNPPEIITRRAKERDLFFDGKWSSDGTAILYPVKKPSYTPDWANGRRIDIMPDLEAFLS